MTKENKSGLTAIHRNKISAPANYLLSSDMLKGNILDYGCGIGKDVEDLRAAGLAILGYDPNQTKWSIKNTVAWGKKYDTILCTYVLNVVDEPTRNEIVLKIRSLLAKNGTAYVSVRRDIKEDFVTKKGTEQYVVRLSEEIVKKNSSFCIYKIVK